MFRVFGNAMDDHEWLLGKFRSSKLDHALHNNTSDFCIWHIYWHPLVNLCKFTSLKAYLKLPSFFKMISCKVVVVGGENKKKLWVFWKRKLQLPYLNEAPPLRTPALAAASLPTFPNKWPNEWICKDLHSWHLRPRRPKLHRYPTPPRSDFPTYKEVLLRGSLFITIYHWLRKLIWYFLGSFANQKFTNSGLGSHVMARNST